MYRDIMPALRRWKEAPGRKPLLLTGVRQCGKTYAARKYLCEDKRELHTLAAGSLLGVAVKHRDVSFPVGLVHRLERVSVPEVPLSFAADATYFKVYLSDVGLLRRRASVPARTILEGGGEGGLPYSRFKGALTENFVMTELRAQGLTPFFWRSGNSAEVDFLIEREGEAFPIEVKSANNTRAKSFRQFVSQYRPRLGFKVSLKNVGPAGEGTARVWSLPLYMLWKLGRYLDEA